MGERSGYTCGRVDFGNSLLQMEIVMPTHRVAGIRVMLGDPVVVAWSEPGEARWGFHQFPKLSWLPSGASTLPRLLMTWSTSADDDLAYGRPGPAKVSDDLGATWQPFAPAPGSPEAMLTVAHSPISRLNNFETASGDDSGGGLCTPFPIGRSIEELPHEVMARPLARYFAYEWRSIYRLSDMPEFVRTYFAEVGAVRYDARTGRWEHAAIRWDTDDMLMRVAEGKSWTRSSFEEQLITCNGELLYPDYKSFYLLPDGSPPRNHVTWLMASSDGGRSFERRALVAADARGERMMAEAELAVSPSGELVCVLRCTDQRQLPMVLTRSRDAGRTWSPVREVQPFGVLPQIETLGCGVMVMSFGRPGVWLSFACDGKGETWSEPLPVIAGDRARPQAHSCGYTNLLPLDDGTFLLAYCDFCHPATDGRTCKAILVRTVEVCRA